jgi:GNAT superfamily N-acetyltransferase
VIRKDSAMLIIHHVRTEDDADAVRALVPQYVDWLLIRYADHAETIRRYFDGQDIEGQKRDLLTLFAPPRADCLLARLDGVPVGMVMVKPVDATTCEMNRMFVTGPARGNGVGRALVAEIIAKAKALGYTRMQLTAGTRHDAAFALFRGMGFAADDSISDTGAGDLEYRMSRAL